MLLSVGAPGQQQATGPDMATVPYAALGSTGLILATVRLNGRGTCTFILDTGWPNTSIVSEAAKRLGLTRRLAHAADGSPLRLPPDNKAAEYVLSPTLEIGSIRLNDVPLIVVDGSRLPSSSTSAMSGQRIDGILGANVMKFLAIVFDGRGSQITIIPGGNIDAAIRAKLGFLGASRVPLSIGADDEVRVHAKLNGDVAEDLLVDTGSDSTAISARAAKALKLRPERVGTPKRGIFGDFTVSSARLALLTLGPLSISDMQVDYPDTDRAGMEPRIGVDIFKRFAVLFDFPAHMAYFKLAEGSR